MATESLSSAEVQQLTLAQLQQAALEKKKAYHAELDKAAALQAAIEHKSRQTEELFSIFLPQFPDEKRRQAAVAILAANSSKLVLPYLDPLPFVTAIATGTLSAVEVVDFSSNSDLDDDCAVILAQALKFAPSAQHISDVFVGQTGISFRGATALMEAVLSRGQHGSQGPLRLSLAGCLPPNISVTSTNSAEAKVAVLLAKVAELQQDRYCVTL